MINGKVKASLGDTNSKAIAEMESVVYDYEPMQAEPRAATRWQFLWLCGLILSFCYELALVEVTTMDRINPRLFDIAFLIGVFTVLPGLKTITPLPRIFKTWAWLVAVFAVCALIWTVWLPVKEIGFSLFYLVKYLEGLLAMYMVARIPLTARQKKIIHSLVIVGGIVVAIYAIPEYLRGGVSRVLVEKADKEVSFKEGQFFSCLGASYFHVAWFCALASVMTLIFFQSAKNFVSKLVCLGLGLFISWPAFVCGARSGILICFVAWISLFFLSRASFKAIVVVLIMGSLVLSFVFAPKAISWETLLEKSSSLRRIETAEEKGTNAIVQRLKYAFPDLNLYRWQGWRIPFIGAAFYVAPHTYEDGTRKFRHAYGIHNAYMFALEQGGLAAFVLFILFLVQCWKDLNKTRHSEIPEDVAFAVGIESYFIGMVILNLVGGFWLGVSTRNFMFYVIILFIIATKVSIPDELYFTYSDNGLDGQQ
jgi:hypothetical protein